MTEKAKPTIFRIVRSDHLAYLGTIIPIIILIMYIVTSVAYYGYLPGFREHDPIQGNEGNPIFFYAFIIGLVVGIPLVTWRIRYIQQMFSKSVEVFGQITNISFYRDRGTFKYSYTYQGQAYSGKDVVMETGKTKQLRSGSQVIVLVNPDEPKHALIRDFYI